jgi:hypothetical protein
MNYYLEKVDLPISVRDALDILHDIKPMEIKLGEQAPSIFRRISIVEKEQKQIPKVIGVALRKNWIT